MGDMRDSIDRQLTGLLLVNARQSVTALAPAIGSGPDHRARTQCAAGKQRTDLGLFSGPVGVPVRRLRPGVRDALIVQKRRKDVLSHLQSLPEVISCSTISGDFDLLAVIQAAP